MWVKASIFVLTFSTTLLALWPTFKTAIPAPKSRIELPSTSIIIAPSARSINTGKAVPSEAETASPLRLINSADLGPGEVVGS